MIILIRTSLVILAASVIDVREAWFTSRPLHVRQFLPDRAGIGLHRESHPFGTHDGHDPERAGAATLDVLIIRVPRVTWFTAHIVLRYGQEGVAVTCACRLARMRTTWARED